MPMGTLSRPSLRLLAQLLSGDDWREAEFGLAARRGRICKDVVNKISS